MPKLPERFSFTPLTLGALMTLCALVGMGVSAGAWIGSVEQVQDEHARRLSAYEQRIERLEGAIFDIRLKLGRIDSKLDRIGGPE